MPSAPLTISNLSCLRGNQPVCAPISFELHAGQTLILRGENGSGKSTLLRTLAGYIPNSSLIPHSSSLYLGHTNALHPSLTTNEHLDFWRGLQQSRDISNDVILKTLGLEANKRVMHLSNGQKRRLSFARLLLHPAQLWLLDEPSAALDKDAHIMLLSLIAQHTAQGGICIIASHDELSIPAAQTLYLQAAA